MELAFWPELSEFSKVNDESVLFEDRKMNIKRTLNILIFLLLIILVGCGCKDKMAENKKPPYLANRGIGIHYYTWCAFKQKPAVCSGEITESEAKKRKTYYKIHYNEKKLPIIYEKYLDGKLYGRQEYIYSEEGGLEKIITTNSEGKIKELEEW